MSEEILTTPFASRVLNTPAASYPKALAKAVSEGSVTFDWLDADGNPVDSGNSIALYSAVVLDQPSDAELIAGIELV